MLASLPESDRKAVLNSLSNGECTSLLYDWWFWRHDYQRPPDGDWRVWLQLGGRGSGKTRAGAEELRRQVEECGRRYVHLIGPTAADVRDVMVEGESGILAVSPPWNRPLYEPSKRRLTWPNGAHALLFSADEPERLRGPQCEWIWADEPCAWRYVQQAWDMLMFGLRLGDDPRCIVTTTPKSLPWLKDLIAQATTVTTRSTTYDNRANLAPAFFDDIVARYEGSQLGRQELLAHILEDIEDALWQRAWIEKNRVNHGDAREYKRIVVGVDPAGTHKPGSAETGIIVGGLGLDNHSYIIDDLSCRVSPSEWAYRVVEGYERYSASYVAAEVNMGWELVKANLHTIEPTLPVREVRATRGKRLRAEPVVTLYEQGRVHHVGTFGDLEDQMCTWVPGESDVSPDRVDALVHTVTDLALSTKRRGYHLGVA